MSATRRRLYSEQVREGCARVSDARDEPGSGRYCCAIGLRVLPDRDKRGLARVGVLVQRDDEVHVAQTLRFVRKGPTGASRSGEALYRNGWPGSANRRPSAPARAGRPPGLLQPLVAPAAHSLV
jgi:hypothetical protein